MIFSNTRGTASRNVGCTRCRSLISDFTSGVWLRVTPPWTEIAWNLGDSQARAVFVEDERLEAAVRQAADDLAAGSLHGFDDAPELGSKLSAAERIWRLDGTGEDLSRLIGVGTAVEDDELERRRTSRGLERGAS